MLVFLDIDGVMTPAAGWKPSLLMEDGFTMFSQKAIKALQKLVSDYNPSIILTTSHKSRFTIDEWKKIFERRGINVQNLARLEANEGLRLKRKEEILEWFNLNNVDDDFIIIDDDKSLNDLPPFLKKHLVLTSSLIGLTNEHLTEIQGILKPYFRVA